MSTDSLDLVYAAIDEVESRSGIMIDKTPQTPLLGNEGVDSLTLVNLIVALEEQIRNKLGKSIVLVNHKSISEEGQPFRTVGALATLVQKIIS
jgi:acyl carrier protein